MTLRDSLTIPLAMFVLLLSISLPLTIVKISQAKVPVKIESVGEFKVGDVVYFKGCPEWNKFVVRRVTTDSVFLYSPTYLNGELVNKSLLTHTNESLILQ